MREQFIEYGRLRFRRQFLVCHLEIPIPNGWNSFELRNDLRLYVHPDLEVSLQQGESAKLVLLGSLYDAKCPEKGNEEILGDLAAHSASYGQLLNKLSEYAGQFVLLYITQELLNIVHDALGLREVYYCTTPNRVLCGSQPTLLKAFSDPPLGMSKDPDILSFKNRELRQSRNGRFWIGEETYFQDIKHLLPNRYLSFPENRVHRYWPRRELKTLNLEDIVERSCTFLQGMLTSAAYRHRLMMAVTGGTDSRTLLAASRAISDKIYYFINKHKEMAASHPDISIPTAMFGRIGLLFHVHNVSGEVDGRFREIFLGNTAFATELVLPAVYNVYYRYHGDKVNILGVGEIGRSFYGKEPKELDGYFLARALKFRESSYAVNECQKWLDEVLPVARRYGVNIMTLLLWEQLLGNWGAVGNSESDIAIDEFDPFNSHYLYELFLSVDRELLKKRGDIIFLKMIERMWPDLLAFPINPPKDMADRAKLFLRSAGLLDLVKSWAFRYDRWRFKFKSARNR